MNKHEGQNPLIRAFRWLHMNEVHIQSYIKVKKLKLLNRKINVNIQLHTEPCPQDFEYLQS